MLEKDILIKKKKRKKEEEKKALGFKKKPLSALFARFLVHADFPSPNLPIWGLSGNSKTWYSRE